MVIKRIRIWSLAKLSFVLYALIGLLFGLIVAGISVLAGAASGLAGAHSDLPGWAAPALGVGALIICPIFCGILGLIFGAIGGAFYNLAAKIAGGLEIEV